MYGNLSIPAFEGDTRFHRLILKTTVDAKKAFRGAYGNFVTKALMDKFTETVDFELKFPFKPVSFDQRDIQVKSVITALIYTFAGNIHYTVFGTTRFQITFSQFQEQRLFSIFDS